MEFRVAGLGIWLPGSGLSFSDVSFHIHSGRSYLLAGANGAGASSVLRAIAARLENGQRRVGHVWLDNQEITRCHPDDIARFIYLVDSDLWPSDLTLAKFFASRRESDEPICSKGEIIERLGLDDYLQRRFRQESLSVTTRARIAAALIANPAILGLDQILGVLESAWKAPIMGLLKRYVDAGGCLLWADQDIATVLPEVSEVIDIEEAGDQRPNWSWRSKNRPATPMQHLAAAVEAVGTDSMSIAGLRRHVMPRIQGVWARPAPLRPAKEFRPLLVAQDSEILVNQTEPLVIICRQSDEARQCYELLLKLNDVTPITLNDISPITQAARKIAHRLKLECDQVLDAMRDSCPQIRPEHSLSQHSRGEQAQISHALARLNEPIRVFLEPTRFLDTARQTDFIHQLWLDGVHSLLNVVITTDVELAAIGSRVMVWTPQGIATDGRGSAILKELPTLPLIAQICAPHPCLDVDTLLEVMQEGVA